MKQGEFKSYDQKTVEEFKKAFNVKGKIPYGQSTKTGKCFYLYRTHDMEEGDKSITGPATSEGITTTPVFHLVDDRNNPGEKVWLMCNQGSGMKVLGNF